MSSHNISKLQQMKANIYGMESTDQSHACATSQSTTTPTVVHFSDAVPYSSNEVRVGNC